MGRPVNIAPPPTLLPPTLTLAPPFGEYANNPR